MRSVSLGALASLASTFALNPAVRAQNAPTAAPSPAAAPAAAACDSVQAFATSDCPLTWHGITLYGTYDIGVGWVSHGLPVNPYNYEGESLINRNGNNSEWLVAPNNLSQTGLGIRGKEEFADGWSVVFNASTGINPNSGQLANASQTQIANNGLPRGSYSEAIDGARAGQPFNDEYFGGVSSAYLGTLTFGRQRALGTDAMLAYDPASGSYAFSYIGYNGTMAGGGDTEDTRWDDAVKYRLDLRSGPFWRHVQARRRLRGLLLRRQHAGRPPPVRPNSRTTRPTDSILAERTPISPSTSSISTTTRRSACSTLCLGLRVRRSPTSRPPTASIPTPSPATNLIDTDNTLYGIVTDNSALMVAAKYTWDPFKFFAGLRTHPADQPRRTRWVWAPRTRAATS